MSLIAVTGGGGFIGSHVVERLLDEGHEVKVLLRPGSDGVGWLDGARAAHPARLRILEGDIGDLADLHRLLDQAEVVLHMAALIGIPDSYVHPREYVGVNVTGTLNLLEAAREAGVARVVHVSTSEVYGTARQTPIAEDHPLSAQSPYAASKAGAEQLALAYHRAFGTPVVVLRPFNAYGPRQTTKALIPSVIEQALAGDVVRLGSLEPRRDMTYVTDTARGIARAAVAPGIVGQEINIGSGVSRAVGEMVAEILPRVNPRARIVQDPARMRPPASEVMDLRADVARGRALLGFQAEVGFADGVERTIAHMRTRAAGAS